MIEVVVAVDVEYEAATVAAVSRLPEAQVVRRPADETELMALVAGGTGHVVVLSRWFPGVDADVVARLLDAGGKIVGLGSDAALFERWGLRHTVGPGAGPDELGAVLRDCADSVVVPPKPEAAPRTPGSGGRSGTLTAVWGTGSSPGRSTLAVVLSHLLARTSGHTVLVDADTVASSLAPMLGLLDDAPQLAALCRLVSAGAGEDSAALAERLSVLEPGFEAVTGLSRAERWPEIRAGVLAEVLDRLAVRAEHVVVDVSDRIDPDDPYADPHYDRHQATRSVLDRADHVLLVAAADPIGLQRLVRLLETERAIALRPATTVVVNRVRASAVGRDAEARIRGVLGRFAGIDDLVLLPEDRETTDQAVLSGRSPLEVARRSALVSACESALLPRIPGARTGRAQRRRQRAEGGGRRRGRGRMSA